MYRKCAKNLNLTTLVPCTVTLSLHNCYRFIKQGTAAQRQSLFLVTIRPFRPFHLSAIPPLGSNDLLAPCRGPLHLWGQMTSLPPLPGAIPPLRSNDLCPPAGGHPDDHSVTPASSRNRNLRRHPESRVIVDPVHLLPDTDGDIIRLSFLQASDDTGSRVRPFYDSRLRA